jgi:hypothetical protein
LDTDSNGSVVDLDPDRECGSGQSKMTAKVFIFLAVPDILIEGQVAYSVAWEVLGSIRINIFFLKQWFFPN